MGAPRVVLFTELFAKRLDLLARRHVIFCRNGHDIRGDQERILGDLFGDPEEHRQRCLMITGSKFQLTHGTVNRDTLQGFD